MTDEAESLENALGQNVPLSDGLDGEVFELAVNKLMKMPRYCESEELTLAKVKLKDGRSAIIFIGLTTETDVVDDAIIWIPEPPNVK